MVVLIRVSLELQSVLASGISQCFDSAVELETGAVECNLRDPGRPGVFSDELTYLGCGRNVAAIFDTCTEFWFDC